MVFECDEFKRIIEQYADLRHLSIKPAEGYLKYDYLVPGGYYSETWDWDGFFIGFHLSSINPDKAIYLKNWTRIFLDAADDNLYIPGCITRNGPDIGHRAFRMKPFLAQGAYFAAKASDDFSWIAPLFEKLINCVSVREQTNFNQKYNLFFWDNAMQSGADNNPALSVDEDFSKNILSCDINTFQLREYKSLSLICNKIGDVKKESEFKEKVFVLEQAILSHLWSEEEKSFFNYDVHNDCFIKKVTYSNFVPLWQKIAPFENGCEMIQKYLLNNEHLLTPYGFRSLSAQEPEYNNENIINPCSNWRGPIWPIANYFYAAALMNYDFDKEAKELAIKLSKLCLKDIKFCGSMHENYDAETGAPLAPKGGGFIGWNLLLENIIREVCKRNNFLGLI